MNVNVLWCGGRGQLLQVVEYQDDGEGRMIKVE